MSYLTLWRDRAPNVWSEPFSNLDRLERLLDRPAGYDPSGMWGPAIDVRENEESWILEAELPGLRIEDVNVSVEEGVLTITGEKKREIEEGTEGGYHFTERRFGRFERTFRLPHRVQADKVSAEFSQGVLTVTLPKAEEAKPKRIEVKVK